MSNFAVDEGWETYRKGINEANLVDKVAFSGSMSILLGVLRKLGFEWKRTRDFRTVPSER